MRGWYGTKRSLIRNQVPLLHPSQTPFHDAAAAPCSKRQSYKLSLLMGRIKAGEHAYDDRVSREKSTHISIDKVTQCKETGELLLHKKEAVGKDNYPCEG